MKVTLRSSDIVLVGSIALGGGSLVSGSDCVCENCRFGNVAFAVEEAGSSPEEVLLNVRDYHSKGHAHTQADTRSSVYEKK